MNERMTTGRRQVIRSIGAAGVAGLAGCPTPNNGGDGGAATGSLGSRSTAVKLGVLAPETGPLSEQGRAIRDAALLPARQLNSAELPVGFDTRVEDTQFDPQAGISAAESLVAAGYPMITGPAFSVVTLEVARDVLIPEQVVGCSPASTSPAVTDLDDDYVFRTAPSDARHGQALAQVATDRRDARTAATLYVDDSYGRTLSESFTSAFAERGGTTQTQVAFQKAQDSYESPLETALADEPDMLLVVGFPASGVQLFRDYYDDYSPDRPIIVTDGLRNAALPNEVGNEMHNVVGTALTGTGSHFDSFEDLHTTEYGQHPGDVFDRSLAELFTAIAYDASAVLILANIAAGENSGSDIRKEMRSVANPPGETVGPHNLPDAVELVSQGASVQYAGASSPVTFDDNGDMSDVSYEVWEFDTGSPAEISQLTTVDFSA